MNAGTIIVICLLCFLVGFLLNESIRTKVKDKEKIPFKEDVK